MEADDSDAPLRREGSLEWPVMEERPEIGVFEYEGTPLEAWIKGRHWCVRFACREVEARSLGEALEEVMGNAVDAAERRRRDRLIIEILLWSQDGRTTAHSSGSSHRAQARRS